MDSLKVLITGAGAPGIRGLANFIGIQISEEYAEAFEVIRWIIR